MIVSVFDVAAFILQNKGELTAMKLHRIIYYCQAWSLVWDEKPLFSERIEAWANGPVVPDLYNTHKGKFKIDVADIQGNPGVLNQQQQETVIAVLRDYGDKSSQWLCDLSRMESPWLKARGCLPPMERGNNHIDLDIIREYYDCVYKDGDLID
jgi:uncharacterized phage-associated protein